jgi:radical SAM-linked protein
MRYTSHLDVHRTWERTLRRARLPLAYSQGFNKRPKINLAAALPLGFTSDCEIVEFWLEGTQPESEIASRLREAAPPGIELLSIEEIDLKMPKIPNLVDSARYDVTLLEPISDLGQRVSDVLHAESLPRERRKKTYDLRPLIETLKITDAHSLDLQLAARSGATGRPEEVLLALGIDPVAARVHRTELILKAEK